QRAAFLRDPPPDAAQRKQALAGLRQMLVARQGALAEAVSADYGHRSRHETLLGEIFVTADAIVHMQKELDGWMRPQRRRVALQFLPARAEVVYQPLGVVGIISPWNYPLSLALGPLAAALAAGNRVMLKPSEFTPATSALLAQLLGEIFAPEQVAVCTGGADVARNFAAQPFDHLLMTGSTATGRLVMRAAADNLVPLTLELGGKSPALVDASFPLARAAASIARGKLFNAGQTCIAPDYVLLPEGSEQAFGELFAAEVAKLYPALPDTPDYTAIVNAQHHARLTALVEDARAKGARVVMPGSRAAAAAPRADRKMSPVLLFDVHEDMAVMQQEIFGPVLPICTYARFDDALDAINRRPRPLALYFFGNDRAREKAVLERTTSGGVTVNDTLLHFAQHDLPFGGVGASGMGAYHGKAGFLSFSHEKAVFRQTALNLSGLIQPPYGRRIERIIAALMRRS
ncbi:MAG: coniferyl aldehyde dehydrogenase, partial [Rhodocyclaceae bacterium]|nr:coniferyl aldehyde dehydrogenase [Rhodocyclaceae bacterium]